MKNVYDEINNINVDYKEEELNDIERQRLINLSKNYSKKKAKKKKIAALAIACGIVFSISIPKVRSDIGKIASDITFSIVDTIGSANDSDKYVAHLYEDIELFGQTIKIENIVFDGDRMYIDIIGDRSYIDDIEEFPSVRKVEIGGKTYEAQGQSGSSYTFDEEKNLAISSMMGVFDKEFPQIENADVKIFFNKSLFESQAISIKANVNLADERKVILAKNMKIKGTDKVSLDYLKLNPVTGHARFLNLESGYDYQLEGYDKEGNKIEFDLRTMDNDVADFYINPTFSDLTIEDIVDGRDITFKLYRAKINGAGGKLTDNDYKQYGEDFILNNHK